MWSFALMGPTLLVLGLLCFVLPIGGLFLHGRPVISFFDKLQWVVETAVLSAGGIWFALWHVRHMRLDRLMPTCPTCNRRVHPDHMGLCMDCCQPVAAAVHVTDREKRERARVVFVCIAIITAVALLTQVRPIMQRMQQGYGQRFRTVIRVVDADDGTVLLPTVFSGSSRGSREHDETYMAGARELVVDWRYPGKPLKVNVSAAGYETVPLELSPESPATMTVPLKRKLP